MTDGKRRPQRVTRNLSVPTPGPGQKTTRDLKRAKIFIAVAGTSSKGFYKARMVTTCISRPTKSSATLVPTDMQPSPERKESGRGKTTASSEASPLSWVSGRS